MTKVSCEIPERYVNPLFEVFDGGDLILSSYRDIEKPLTEMRIYFENASDTEAAKRALSDALTIVMTTARSLTCELPEIIVEEVPEDDWKFAYRRHFKTEQVSARIFTVPEWEAEEFFASGRLTEGQVAIVSDPGLAFGTGKHETTKACLQFIDEILYSRSQESKSNSGISFSSTSTSTSFLDMGTGSGILSIAAAKLGCSQVSAFDVDEEAVEAARENAAKNEVKVDVFRYGLGAKVRRELPVCDLVVANILGPLLIRFADEISPTVGRFLVISGILTELYPEVLAAYAACGFHEISQKTIGEWTTGLLSR